MRTWANGLAISAVVLVVLNLASPYWERGLATKEAEETSPDGCYRLERYRPFWVLPSFLHTQPHPDPEAGKRPFWTLPLWDFPVFYRLYYAPTNDLITETDVYEGTSLGQTHWGPTVAIGMLKVADIHEAVPCSHAARRRLR
ncbi:hypothetical protein [Lysobacter auxotrophicus]|uniref:Uncharacterized protein n=1 Tax=Lysobacter auxotrophicus TaxID=2992573 RepID=A0ABN6UNS5_9GAMM|nr:hypothetical protein [Lysobacter auxotrophicus]BDU18059.1 hypothetical protein LA521A_32600 [Lysobacter auxotrophicus]